MDRARFKTEEMGVGKVKPKSKLFNNLHQPFDRQGTIVF